MYGQKVALLKIGNGKINYVDIRDAVVYGYSCVKNSKQPNMNHPTATTNMIRGEYPKD